MVLKLVRFRGFGYFSLSFFVDCIFDSSIVLGREEFELGLLFFFLFFFFLFFSFLFFSFLFSFHCIYFCSCSCSNFF